MPKDKSIKKLTRHNDAVLSVNIINGYFYSCSADAILRVRRTTKLSKTGNVTVRKPDEQELYPFLESSGGIDELDPYHPLNTEAFKSKMMTKDAITCYEFYDEFVYSGFGDGLICAWHIGQPQAEDIQPEFYPFLGHTNKVNAIKASPELNRVFSCSDDCTVRQWSLD